MKPIKAPPGVTGEELREILGLPKRTSPYVSSRNIGGKRGPKAWSINTRYKKGRALGE